jgi:arsenate reductase-like glutaredoxin family protein
VRELDPAVEERNYAKSALTKAEIEEIVKAAGLENVINLRHEVAKTQGWKEKAPSKASFVAAALEDNNLLRRPVVIDGGRAVVGFDEAGLKKLLRG